MYSVLVFSPYKGDGKTTLIEKVIGRPLEWKHVDLSSTVGYSIASVEYRGVQIEIKELEPIGFANEDVWEQIADMFTKANRIVFVRDSTKKTILDRVDDFLEEYDIPSTTEDKTWIVFTKSDATHPIQAYWDSLSEEQKEQLNNSLSGELKKRFKSWDEGAYYDWNLCLGLYFFGNWAEAPIFDVDCTTMRGIAELRQKINELI